MLKQTQVNQMLDRLEKHLKQENPILEDVVKSYRDLDKISRTIGFLTKEESFASRTPWWPVISILGTYSSGKSTFINHYLNYDLQATGNQAVDDKFTVICYSSELENRRLPGVALDADPRLPLYRISKAIEEVDPGAGQRVDSYMQLKTCSCDQLRGKIIIDSPGFDADAQRSSTLRITDRIVDLSDLVLVFFDARHPETGSMKETLEHLVRDTVKRRDATKFLYILNQIDVASQEDNPEQIFASWQRALVQQGLSAGNYYCIYNPKAAVHIEDENLRRRYEKKRDRDLKEISNRIEQVTVERAYRIVVMLEETCAKLKNEVLPTIRQFLQSWRRQIIFTELIILAVLIVLFLWLSIWQFNANILNLGRSFFQSLSNNILTQIATGVVIVLAGWFHFGLKRKVGRLVRNRLVYQIKDKDFKPYFAQVFDNNVRWWRSIWCRKPRGWNDRTAQRLSAVQEAAKNFIQRLNDIYTDPGGQKTDKDQDDEKLLQETEPILEKPESKEMEKGAE